MCIRDRATGDAEYAMISGTSVPDTHPYALGMNKIGELVSEKTNGAVTPVSYTHLVFSLNSLSENILSPAKAANILTDQGFWFLDSISWKALLLDMP